MIWDACLARAVAGELARALVGARARSASLRRADAIAEIRFRDATLMIDLAPGRGFVALGPASQPGRAPSREPDPETTRLPAVLTAVDAVEDERAFILRFRRTRGRGADPVLVVELAPQRWNVLLAEGPSLRVVKRLRRTKGDTPPIGQPWTAPGVAGGGSARRAVTEAEWTALVRGEDPVRALLSAAAYASGINAPSLASAVGPGEGYARWSAMAAGEDPRPHVLDLPAGPQPYPWPLPGVPSKPVASLTSWMRAASERPSETLLRIARERGRLERKLAQLGRQLERASRVGELRERGSMILASLASIEPGAARVELTGFDGETRTVDLDPGKSPQATADGLFRKARRLERGARRVAERIAQTEARIAQLADLSARLERGEDPEVPRPLRAALEGGRRSRGPSRPQADEPSPPYASYVSSGGIEIRVGRGAAHNDRLTFRHSRPEDVWLHARHAAGAHVVLRWARRENPPRADLEEAATLAAVHSKARGSAVVPVDWTRRKWVRKPRRAPRGAVALERVRTVFVRPDPSLAERLGRPK